jgi:glycosyltransferase involved in cell wall biosynthesis
VADRPTILTWGLLGPGKGIEWAVEAMAGLADLDPRPRYCVVGQTHPRVVEWAGEAYRNGLEAQVAELGLADHVAFDGRYLDGPTLRSIVRAADIILLPYDSRDQVTSGVLTEAVVAGKPVVSTSFPHAVELLSSGAGLLVPQGDSGAIQEALRTLLTDPVLTAGMAQRSRSLAPGLLWPAVADQYIAVGEDLLAEGARSVA